MTFDELKEQGEFYFKNNVGYLDWEWFNAMKEALKRNATQEEIEAIHYHIDYNSRQYDGCDILNAFNAGYWLARKELGLPKCD